MTNGNALRHAAGQGHRLGPQRARQSSVRPSGTVGRSHEQPLARPARTVSRLEYGVPAPCPGRLRPECGGGCSSNWLARPTSSKCSPISPSCERISMPLVQQKDAARALVRSRGGLSTKIHALVDGLSRLARCSLSPGQVHDSLSVKAPLKGLNPSAVVAEKSRRHPCSAADHRCHERRGRHPFASQPQRTMRLGRAQIQASQPDRAILRPFQTVSSRRHTLRQTHASLPIIHSPVGHLLLVDLNVNTL